MANAYHPFGSLTGAWRTNPRPTAGLGWTQLEAASRAGISYRPWRRLKSQGKASIEDLVRAAFALRCEADLEALFPEPPARSMDELLARQAKAGS